MPDRSQAPQTAPLNRIFFPKFDSTKLSNGIPLHVLDYGQAEVLTIQAVFRSGAAYEHKTGLSEICARMMTEGTQRLDSLELAQQLDNFGAYLGYDAEMEFVSLQLYSLNKHLPATLPLFVEVLLEPAFSEKEYNLYQSRMVQHLKVAHLQTTFHADNRFPQLCYGENHPYSAVFDIPQAQQITQADIVAYYKTFLGMADMQLVVVGRVGEEELNLLERCFGAIPIDKPPHTAQSAAARAEISTTQGRFHLPLADSVQASLRLGHLATPLKHTDTDGMRFVNTLLGGYFGSRLMTHLREKASFTYGVYSAWVSRLYAGHFLVQCEVENKYADAAIEAIKQEIRLLQQEKVSEGELQLVKQYLLGTAINQRETAFQMANYLRSAVVNDWPFEHLERRIDCFQSMSAEKVRELAQAYLKPEALVEVVCGGA